MDTPGYVAPLTFDADFFGGPVWKLREPMMAAQAVAVARKDGVKLIVAHGADGDFVAAGFRKVVTMLTYRVEIPWEDGDGFDMRDDTRDDMRDDARDAAGEEDAIACAELARKAFTHDRYHADPRIPTSVADELKATWAYNGAMGRTRMFVTDGNESGAIGGFLAYIPHDPAAPPGEARADGIIDLIAVRDELRGRGHGARLFRMACHVARGGGGRHIRAGTQDTNTVSIAFYEKMGFEIVGQNPVWHWMPE